MALTGARQTIHRAELLKSFQPYNATTKEGGLSVSLAATSTRQLYTSCFHPSFHNNGAFCMLEKRIVMHQDFLKLNEILTKNCKKYKCHKY